MLSTALPKLRIDAAVPNDGSVDNDKLLMKTGPIGQNICPLKAASTLSEETVRSIFS